MTDLLQAIRDHLCACDQPYLGAGPILCQRCRRCVDSDLLTAVRAIPTVGPGDYSCVTCGFGMVEPCEHWKEVLAQPNEPDFGEPDEVIAALDAIDQHNDALPEVSAKPPDGFWEYLKANLEEVRKWPGWMRGGK